MKNPIIPASLLSALAFLSCGSPSTREVRTPAAEGAAQPEAPSSKEAIEYNDKIIGLQNQIVKKMIEFSDTFSGRVALEMETKLSELQDTVDEAVLFVSALGPFHGDSSLSDGAVKVFQFYQSVSKIEYREIVNILLRPQITQEDIDRIDAIDSDIGVREKALDDAFQKIQQDFAKRYSINLVDNRIQKEIDAAGKE